MDASIFTEQAILEPSLNLEKMMERAITGGVAVNKVLIMPSLTRSLHFWSQILAKIFKPF